MSEEIKKQSNTFRNLLLIVCIVLIGYIFMIHTDQKELRKDINRLNAQNIILKTERDKIEDQLNVCNQRMNAFHTQVEILADRMCTMMDDCTDSEKVKSFSEDVAKMMHQVMTIGRMVLIGF